MESTNEDYSQGILLVEDNPEDADLTIRSLEKHNLANDLKHVKDGEEALDFVFAQNSYQSREHILRPKLVLLDIKMPKIDGIEVLRTIKSDPRTQEIPVVILTSSQEDPDIKKCYRLGANSYIVKPVDFSSFVNAVVDVGLYWVVLNKNFPGYG